MTEKNPLFDQISDLENSIISLQSGIHALEELAQNVIEEPTETNASGLRFIAMGFRGVHDDLRERWDRLYDAAQTVS